MRIAIVAPLVSPIDEDAPSLGGAQAVVADLARGLATRGHAVSLVAARGSRIRGVELVDCGIDASALGAARFDGRARDDDDAQRSAFACVAEALAGRAAGLDIVHAHAYDAAAFDALDELATPVLHTLHLPPVDGAVVHAAAASGAMLASVSRACAAAWRVAGVRIDEVLPNGVDLERIPFGAVADGSVLCAGRIAPEKGVADAIRAARAVGRRLLVVGDVYDPDYAKAELWPLLDDDVALLGPLPRRDVHALMSRATAVLMPVHWDEPFGLVAIEAQAAGAPVVAYRRGGLAEVVRSGETGFLVEPDDERALAGALARAAALDRAACRAHVAERFSLDAMLDAHERAYARAQTFGRNVSARS